MGWDLVAQGSVVSLVNLAQYEDELAEGSRNLLELELRLPVTEGVAQTLEDQLRNAGVADVEVIATSNPHLKIYFTKGFPWLAVIAAIVLGSLIVAALVISWKLFTYVGAVSPETLPFLIIGIIAAIVVGGLYIARRKTT